jgi:hypothetical protein
MKIDINLLEELVEPDILDLILEEIKENTGKKPRRWVKLTDIRDVMGDKAYRKHVLKKIQ